ncbi:PPE domain-containing protein [Nocardia sp. CA2R105]|uniref:PPE domain-containing protein n=1 Tax=Nocardia coffeae TaxID=2873381 RepID=UPI001CA6EA32|nr:PPE domain-containing protein [Nocardia coffeae]MBY8858731.1 PPE domain-containing protein [Nocardia coffeae]
MVAGITGVVWEARPAEINSATLHLGAHAIPISAAAPAWAGLTAAWTDATATLTRVMAELGVGLLGVNGIAAMAQITAFTGWCGEQTVMAGAMAAKATANATAYTVASLVMPSPPEIAAVDAARVAAHASGGDVCGAGEAAEAAYMEIQIRAALVMETYEAATSLMVATPAAFLMPPPIAIGAGAVGGALDVAQAAQADVNPVANAISAAQTAVSSPGASDAATQVAGVAGSVATSAVPTVGDAAGSAISAATNTTTAAPGMSTSMVGGLGGLGGGAIATRAVSFAGGGSIGIGNGAGNLQIPEGWGAGLGTNFPTATAPEIAPTTPASANSTQPASTRPVSNGNPLLGNQAEEEEDLEHKNELVHGEYFNDGRIIAAGVIGGDPNAESAR